MTGLAFARARARARARPPATARIPGREGRAWERCGGGRRCPSTQGSSLARLAPGTLPPQPPPRWAALTRSPMVGPEDVGACPGRNPKLLPVPAPEPAGLDGKMIRATGGFGGGVDAVEPPEEEEEKETPPPPRQLLRRYLTGAGGQLEPGLCYCPLPACQPRAPPPFSAPLSDACPPYAGSKHRSSEMADACAARHEGMTNGDSGFLPGQDCRDLASAGGREPRHSCLRLEGPGDVGADGEGNQSDWAAPLEDPLRSCCLAAADTEKTEGTGSGSGGRRASDGSGSEDVERPGAGSRSPEEGASAVSTAERTSGGADAEPRLRFSDVRLNSRNTFEVSRLQSARDHLPSAVPWVPSPAAEQGPAGTSARARRSGGFADFFARYSAGFPGARGGFGAKAEAESWLGAAWGPRPRGSRWH